MEIRISFIQRTWMTGEGKLFETLRETFLGNNFEAEADDNIRDKDERTNTLP